MIELRWDNLQQKISNLENNENERSKNLRHDNILKNV